MNILLNKVCVHMWFEETWAMDAINCGSSTEWVVSTHNKASCICFLNKQIELNSSLVNDRDSKISFVREEEKSGH